MLRKLLCRQPSLIILGYASIRYAVPLDVSPIVYMFSHGPDIHHWFVPQTSHVAIHVGILMSHPHSLTSDELEHQLRLMLETPNCIIAQSQALLGK